MNCPKCFSPMVRVLFEGVEVDRCIDCHGLWFDVSEREDLMKRRASEAIDNGDAQLGSEFNRVNFIFCPRCGSQMMPRVAQGRPRLEFEQCTICAGSFFDAGEFRFLKQHPSIRLPAY
jgi:Zn-finger nucleic acid-binding protein